MSMVVLEDCLNHLNQLKLADTAILGVEGFVLDNGNRTPNLDAIADFSSLSSADWALFLCHSHDAAKKFINALLVEKSCDAFEFTVSTRANHERN